MRNVGRIKLGYYPLPAAEGTRLRHLLRYPAEIVSVLDPCVGTAIAKRSQLPVSVMRDLIAGNLKYTSEGDDMHGYRVSMQSLGAASQPFFVSREDGQYKIVASGPIPPRSATIRLICSRTIAKPKR